MTYECKSGSQEGEPRSCLAMIQNEKAYTHHTLCRVSLPVGKIFRPAPHPFGLRVDNRLSAFLQAREQVLIRLRTSFKERPKVLDEMEPALPELLLRIGQRRQSSAEAKLRKASTDGTK